MNSPKVERFSCKKIFETCSLTCPGLNIPRFNTMSKPITPEIGRLEIVFFAHQIIRLMKSLGILVEIQTTGI
ncbi:hypothetical protein CEXT_323621 [Caerostris extrusa]|uniref:Uncharacterized protein n=1 Tax=Caerostris extrusa TaxID=172846 RepID=A0AAV4SB39_CAEEX|nr:hypothetical protein CEXT_323621 [Caerostris extrusa]